MSKEVATIKNQAIANVEARQQDVGLGSENVTMADTAVPRIKLLQQLSPYCNKSDPEFIDGAEPGMLLNTVSNQLTSAVFVVNLYFRKDWIVWHESKNGGKGEGIWNIFSSQEEALEALEREGEDPKKFDIIDTPHHVLMLLDENGTPVGIALLDMPYSKARVSRNWNAMIAEQETKGNPRFGCVWALSSRLEERNGSKYYNYHVEFVTCAGDELYDVAKKNLQGYLRATGSEAKTDVEEPNYDE